MRRFQRSICCFRFAVVTGVLLLNTPLASADLFELVGGGKVTGKLLNDPKSDVYRILTSDGIELEVPKIKITSKLLDGDMKKFSDAYAKALAKKDDSINSHREIADVCHELKKTSLFEAHLERIVELDPNDTQTWISLGYMKDKYDRWIRKETRQMSQGLVKDAKGKWVTPQAKAIAEVDERLNRAKHDVKKELRKHLGNIGKPGQQGFEAAAYIRELNDRLAIPSIVELIKEDPTNATTYLDILERMPGNSAVEALITLANTSNNNAVVNRCLELLQRNEWAMDSAVYSFIGELYSKDIERIRRAGSNLSVIGDKRAILALIDVLKMKGTRTTTAPGTNSFGKGPNGGTSMGTPSTTVTEFVIENPTVLQALSGITGANYAYDMQAWREWYAREFAVTNMNLRRDE